MFWSIPEGETLVDQRRLAIPSLVSGEAKASIMFQSCLKANEHHLLPDQDDVICHPTFYSENWNPI